MMDSIGESLCRAEEELMEAAAQGGHALAAFTDKLSGLLEAVESRIQAAQVDEHTLEQWSTSSWRLMKISEQLFEFQKVSDELSQTLLKDVSQSFNQIKIPSTTAQTQNRSHNQRCLESKPSDYIIRQSRSGFSYIEATYRWLLSNLHNPYPSRAVRSSLSEKTQTPFQIIDAWFIDARKRIGWTETRKNFFSNRRADIVNAATLFFFPDTGKETLDLAQEMQFATIERNAKELYGERLPSGAATSIRDATDQTSDPKGLKRGLQEILQRPRKKQKRNPYPSPPQSSDEVESSSSLSSPLHQDLGLSDGQAVRKKRKRPSPISIEQADSLVSSLAKRPRLEGSRAAHTSSTLPSPPPCQLCISEEENPSGDRVETLGSLSATQFILNSNTGGSRSMAQSTSHDSFSYSGLMSETPTKDSEFQHWFKEQLAADDVSAVDVEIFNYGVPGAPASINKSSQSCISEPLTVVQNCIGNMFESFTNGLEIATQDSDYAHLFDDFEDTRLPDAYHRGVSPKILPDTNDNVSYTSLPCATSASMLPQYQLDTSMSLQSLDHLSNWFMASQYLLEPMKDVDFLSRPPVPAVAFDQPHAISAESPESQHWYLPLDNSQEAKRRRLEEIRHEALRLEQELASSS